MIDGFRPTLYLNTQCPFCLKVRIFLLEAGLRDDVDVEEFAPGSEPEAAIRQKLAAHLAKVTTPAAELSPGEYVADSDVIVTRLADRAGIDRAALPVLKTYEEVALGRIIALFRENAELRQAQS